MRKARGFAVRGYGLTSPNPMVGALVVKEGTVLGKGWHRVCGGPHAEVEAIHDCLRRGFSPAEATLVVTLEPCSTFGKTPPCVDLILRSGIRRVVVGATDPNPNHRGRGLQILSTNGVEVISGVYEESCRELNNAFNHWIQFRTPYVCVKAAMTLDGKIADANGNSKWITGETARKFGHRLRFGSDAILVGINTVLADNPQLNIRSLRVLEEKKRRFRRVILDPRIRADQDLRVFSDVDSSQTILVIGETAQNPVLDALTTRGVTIWRLPTDSNGRIELGVLVKRLGEANITSLLVEGGGNTIAGFLDAGLVHEVAFFYGPIVIGGDAAIPAVGGNGANNEEGITRLCGMRWRRLGEDLLLTARIRSHHVYGNR